MKKSIAAIIALVFLMGCSGIQIGGDESQTIIYKLAGHRLGYEMGKKDAATAQIVVKAVDGIIASIESGTTAPALSQLLQEGLAKLAEGYAGDPALAAEVAIIMELVVLQPGPIDTEAYKAYIAQMKAGLEGYKLGYLLALAVAVK